jgi:DNA-binding transcriptional LysR family regulator
VIARLDLNSLVLFHDVVNAKSITRAAELLRVPKSTISRKLTQLEQTVGGALLKKGRRRLATTDLGELLYEHSCRIVAEADGARNAASQMLSDLRGTLKISIPVDFGSSWISRAIAEFVMRYPEIHLEVDVNSGFVTPRDDPYDLTIQLGVLRESGLTYRRLATIRRGVYASPIYIARRGAPKRIEELIKHDCIVTDQQRHDGVWNLTDRTTKQRRKLVSIAGKVVVNNIGVARDLAINGVGLAILPQLMCHNDVKAHRLIRLLSDWQSPPMDATALVLSRRGIPNKVRAFLDFISDRLLKHSEGTSEERTSLPSKLPSYEGLKELT